MRLTPLGQFTKWVIAPAALAALGYFVVGPTLGTDPKLRDKVQSVKRRVVPRLLPGSAESKPETGPKVEVDLVETQGTAGR